MRRTSVLARTVVFAAFALLATACKGIGDITAPKPVDTPVAAVSLSSEVLTLSVGSNIALQATALDIDGQRISDRAVAWSSSDTSVAIVSPAGLVSAVRTGTATIAASVGGRSATARLTVTARAVASVQVTPTAPNLLVGGFAQLTARTLDESGVPLNGRTVFWSTSDPRVAVVDVAGLVSGISAGVATVTATSESRSAAVGVTVSLVPIATVQLTPTRDSVVLGQSTQLTATPRDSTGAPLSDRIVTWTSSAANIATVSSSGLVLGIAPGAATITASSGGRSSTATIIVQPRPVGAVIVSPTQSALTVGQTVKLTVQITDGSGNLLTGRPTSFTSSNVNVAQVAADGTVTATTPGTATITVSSEGKTGTATVTVSSSPIATLRVSPDAATLLIGGSTKLVAIAQDAGGNVLGQRTVSWTSGAPTVVSVAADGTVTAIGTGTAIVFAASEGRLATATITVAPVAPASLLVTPAVATIFVGGSQDLAAELRDAAGQPISGRAVQWTSSNNAIAIVSNTGRVRGVAPGTARIDASVDGVVGSSSVSVTPIPVASVSVALGAATLLVGQTTNATAVARDAVGNVLTGRAVVWSSANPAVATVSSTGLVTAVTLGSTTIRATVETVVGSTTLAVLVGQPTTIAAASATLQSAAAGTVVSAPPSVKVTDAAGTPVTGVAVTFTLVSGGGSIQPVTPATVTTNAVGVATLTSWTLGTTPGANSVSAVVSGLTGSPVTFNATGTVGSPSTMVAASSLTQSAVAGATVGSPPSVRVTDAVGNPVSGVVVTFAVTAGGGTTSPTSPATVSTNSNGVASLNSWTLGTTAGTNTLTATVAGLSGSPVTFTATGNVGAAATIAAVSATSQSSAVSTSVTTPPSVKVTDANGNAVSGINVSFAVTAGGGSVSPATVATNASGVATLSSWTLGATAGANTVTASATGLSGSPVTFNATGTAGVAKTIVANSALTQSAVAGTTVAAPPSVRVTDANNNPVQGVVVAFAVASGGGSVSSATVSTNGSGIATLSSWTLGTTAGANSVTASVPGLTGSPVTFSATGTVGAAALLAITTQPAGAVSGAVLTVQPVIEVRDINGNRTTSTASVTASIASGLGVLSGTTTVSAANGVATFTDLKITGLGAQTLSFTSTGLTSVTSGTVTVTAGAPTTIAANSAVTQSATAGTAVTTPPSVKVTDLLNNPVSGVSVAFAVTAGGGSVTPASVLTNASGIATLTSWTVGNVAGANTVTATVAGLLGSPVTFNATGTVGAATTIAANSATTQSATVSTAVTAPPSVKITDAVGNGVGGVSVTFTLASGGGVIAPASPATVLTNASGVATLTSWTLGATAGANTVTAAATGLSGSPITFTATGTVGTPTAIAANSVVTQSAIAGTAVTAAPSVRVTDAGGNPLNGVSVTFTVTAGGGITAPASPATVSTNASGIATLASWTLGATVGANTITATAAGLAGSPVTFNATGTVGAATKLAITTQPAGAVSAVAFTTQPVVEIRDANNNRTTSAASVTVAIATGPGVLSGTTTVGAANGVATFSGLKITGTGTHTLTFTSTGLTSATSGPLTVTAGTPTTIAANSTQAQSAVAGSAVTAPSVLVTDANGTPVSGVGVTFTVSAGAGVIVPASPATVLTNASGVATLTSWTLGTTAGANTVTAAVTGLTGSPVAFNATGTVGAASQITAVSATAQSATISTAVTAPPSVKVSDSNGNGVAGVSVTFAVTTGAGTIVPASPATIVTNASGIATLTSWTLGASAGANALTATAAGLTGSPVTFNATGTVGTPTTIAANSALSQSNVAGTAVAAPPSVRVTDAGGNPVSGVSVTFTVASGGGSTSPTSPAVVSTNASGIATLTNWTLGVTAGANTLNATVTGLSGSPVAFSATGTVGAAAAITAFSASAQSAPVGTNVTTPPSVKVADANGNGVSGVTVTFAVVSGGGSISPASVVSNASGIAALSSWTLGTTAGANSVSATATGLSGSPLTFTATGTAGAATTIASNSLTTQSATAGTAVAAPPSVKVTDANGNGVSGVTIAFAVASGGGAISPASVITNASGIATLTSWTLGATVGANSVTATAASLAGSPVTFNATGTVGAAATLAANSVLSQSAAAGAVVATPPSVKVTDAGGNPVSSVTVSFAVASGGGAVSPASAQTNASGIATLTSWTLGTTAGANSVTATVAGLTGSPVTFTATGTAGAAANIAANSALSQSATVNTAVAAAPSVKVTDANNNAVSGVSVAFAVVSGGGTVTPATVVTNASGIATATTWTLGATAGANSLTASATGLTGSPVTFTATGTVGAATTIAATSSTTQSATVGTTVAAPPSVRVTDAGSNPVSGVTVTFAVVSGGGTINAATVATNASGIAALTAWTLGTTAGANSVTATATGLTGSPITFNASGTAGAAATIAANAVLTQSAPVNTNVATPPSVKVTDANGNAVSGTTVTFAVASGGGAVNPATVVSNASGIATLTSWTLGAAVGANSVTATAAGLSGSPITFNATATAGAATTIAANSVITQSATVNTAVAAPPSVKVTDAGNNPVSGVTVTFAVTSGGGAVSPTSVVTNVSGIATLTSWTLGTTAGANSVTATSGSLTGSPVAFSATGVAGAATTIVANSALTQSGTVNATVTTPPSVKVTDANGNGVSGITVTFAVANGGGAITPATVNTNAGGIATLTSWTLGAAPGANSVTATASGLTGSPVTFSATGSAGAATTIAANSAQTQSATAGTAVSAPPRVLVTDAGGNPVSGTTVSFAVASGGGSVSPASVVTNASGIATLTSWTLGTTAGANSATATAAGLSGSPVTFNATGTVGAATVLSAQSTLTQSAAVNANVAAPPSVKVSDANGNGVSGVSVAFAVASGGGAISPASVATNASGVATLTSWTLGAAPGANSVTATAAGLTGSPVTFNATATAGAATTIAPNSVQTQSATVNTTVAAPPSVKVTDAGGNAVSGVTVSFAVTSGGGAVSPASVITNASGIATLTSWTLGTTAGANSVTATSGSLTGSPVTFNATGVAGAAATIAAVSTTSQSAPVSTAVAAPPSVKVSDANGNGVAGTTVSFAVASGGGAVSPASVVTNASGIATLTSWTLGASNGANSVTATAAGLTGSPVTFTATATAGAATTIAAVSVVTQSAVAGTPVSAPPSVRVTDAGSNPVNGVSVTFAVASGGGSINTTSVSTNASGIASLTTWTLGATVGANSVTATVAGLTGSPVTFNATGTVGAASVLTANSALSQSTTAGATVTTPPSVKVTDANNNPVSGVTVSFAVASGGGAVSPATVATNASGVATLTSWTLGAAAGANSVTATAAGLSGSPITFTATGVAGAAANIVALSTTNQSATAGSNVAAPPSVKVTDSNNNPVSGYSVAFAVTSGGGTVSPGTVVTDVNGVATLTSWKLGNTAGANSVTATGAGLTGSPVTFNATGVAGVATQMRMVTQPGGATDGVAFAAQPAVEFLDANNNRTTTSGTVTVSIASGVGGTLGTTVTATASAGLATFSGVLINGTGTFTLQFSFASPALSVTSSAFTVN